MQTQIGKAAAKVRRQYPLQNPATQTGPRQSVCVPAKLDCEICGGSKVYRYDVPLDDPRFGRLFPCPNCNRDALLMTAGLLPAEQMMTLAEIETHGRAGAAAMVQQGRQMLEKRAGMLAVHGGYGNGKSTFLKAMTAEFLRLGIEARYTTLTELLAYAREAFDSKQAGDSDFGRISKWAKVQAVMIDECDKARSTQYAVEIQTLFFDERYRRANELVTVAAWNGERNALGLPWVVSRFSEHVIVENTDADMRPLLGGA